MCVCVLVFLFGFFLLFLRLITRDTLLTLKLNEAYQCPVVILDELSWMLTYLYCSTVTGHGLDKIPQGASINS